MSSSSLAGAARIAVRKSVTVAAPVALAFEVFTARIESWWPMASHHIGDADAFLKTALAAAELASNGWLVSFGIRPTGPDTGFGYLRHGFMVITGCCLHGDIALCWRKGDDERTHFRTQRIKVEITHYADHLTIGIPTYPV